MPWTDGDRIPLALEKLAGKFGAKINYNCPVEDVSRNGSGLCVKQGANRLTADYVVINADYAYSQTELLKRSVPDFRYSCSTYLIYLGMKKKLSGLAHH